MNKNLMDISGHQDSTKYYADYWHYIVSHLNKTRLINDKCYRSLGEILSSVKVKSILNYMNFSASNMQKDIDDLQKSFKLLQHMLDRRGLVFSERPDYRNFFGKFAVNTEKYIDDFFELAPLYLVLYQMFKDSYIQLYLILESKKQLKRFGKQQLLYGGFYCISAITDLITTNVSRGDFYKRSPKDLTEKVEYVYDENGNLLMCKWHRDNDSLHYIELFIYSEQQIIRLGFESNGNEGFSLIDIVLQTYQDNLICSYHHTIFSSEGIIRRMMDEKYIYMNGRITEGWEEDYYFPGLSEKSFEFLNSRKQYIFKWNNYGFISGYRFSEWLGDGLLRTSLANHIVEISDKKKQTTGKDAPRWKRPNYFIK